jgi:hypothetical protein
MKTRYKLGDVVCAIADADDNSGEKYVIGYISHISFRGDNPRFKVEWANGLCCDVDYPEETIYTYKKLLKEQLAKK